MKKIVYDDVDNAWLVLKADTVERKFHIGTVIKPGDELFEPRDESEFVDHIRKLQEKRGTKDLNISRHDDGVHVDGVISQDGINIPFGAYIPFPAFGNGIRVARSIDEAKSLAEEFAEIFLH